MMKKILLLAAILGLWTGAARMQTNEELVNDGKNTDNVTTQSMGYDRKSYSPLKQINKTNVKRLVPVWNASLMNDTGELAAPTVYNGVMYAINGKWTFAIDVETGRQIWRTPVQLEPGVTRNPINRGAATIYNGKLYRVTVDNHLVALDMKTGKQVWNQKYAESKDGYLSTSAPIVANGVVISGMAGGESTTRGFLDGWDPETGKKLWRRYTIPAPGEPGSETWPKDDSWKQGGGPTWRSGSYDPQLDLVYWGTGNAEPYDPRPRGELDSLYTSSVLAIRPKTGEIACYFQYTPNDVYDVDGTDENVLADIRVGGQMRKVMIQANKNGFMYVLDRTNCKLIAANAYVKINWASGVDLGTGRPVLTDLYRRFLGGEEVEIYPQRGTNAVPIAFNPNTGLVYATTWNMPRIQKLADPPKPVVPGGESTGVTARLPEIKPGSVMGHLAAIYPLTGQRKWEIPLTDFPSSSGMLATGGGLVFTGKLSGEFIALDEDTGKTLWQFKTGSSINSTAITYTHKGRQYVSIASGLGGGLARRWAADAMPTGGSMWTFALLSE
jgi:alcohol dehydrogenase (cytochrome c)